MNNHNIIIEGETFHAEQTKLELEKVELQQIALRHEVKNNANNCLEVKHALTSLVTAAISAGKKKNAKSCASSSSNASFNTVVHNGNTSLESIQHIDSDTSSSSSEVEERKDVHLNDIHEQSNEEDVPGLKQLINLIAQGKIKLTDEVLMKLNEQTIKIEAACKVSSDLQERMYLLDTDRKVLEKRIDSHQQYIKLDNLLFHKWPLPRSKNLSSLEFSMYMANCINYFLPHLPVPVTWEHISDAHPLKTKSRKSKVIIVRFCNRNIRHEIYSQRALVKAKGMSITEHLMPSTLNTLNRARDLFGYKNVTTEKCCVFVTVNGKSIKVNDINHINELFESVNSNHTSTITTAPLPNPEPASNSESSPASNELLQSMSPANNDILQIHSSASNTQPHHKQFQTRTSTLMLRNHNNFNNNNNNAYYNNFAHPRDNYRGQSFSYSNRGRGMRYRGKQSGYSVRSRNY